MTDFSGQPFPINIPSVAGWESVRKPAPDLPCGHPSEYGMSFTDTSGKKVETHCMKCLTEKVAKLEAQVQVQTPVPAGRLEFSDYKQISNWTNLEVQGWVFLGVVYMDNITDISEEIESSCQQNNWCPKYAQKKYVLRTPEYLFGKPIDPSTLSAARVHALEHELGTERNLRQNANETAKKYADEREKLRLELANLRQTSDTALATEGLLRVNTEKNLRDARAKILELAVKLSEIEAQDNQEPMRRKLPGVLPVHDDDHA